MPGLKSWRSVQLASFKAKGKSPQSTELPSASSESEEDAGSATGRRQRAFECGVRTAEGQAGTSVGWAETVRDGVALSPRSFARGAKAAEVAAKAAAELQQRRIARKSEKAIGRVRPRHTQCSSRAATPVGSPAPSPFGTPKSDIFAGTPFGTPRPDFFAAGTPTPLGIFGGTPRA